MNRITLLYCVLFTTTCMLQARENNNESLLKKRVCARRENKKLVKELALERALNQKLEQQIRAQEDQLRHLRAVPFFTVASSTPPAADKKAVLSRAEAVSFIQPQQDNDTNFINGNFELLKKHLRRFSKELFNSPYNQKLHS